MTEVSKILPTPGERPIDDDHVAKIVHEALLTTFQPDNYEGQSQVMVNTILNNLTAALSRAIIDGLDEGKGFPSAAGVKTGPSRY